MNKILSLLSLLLFTTSCLQVGTDELSLFRSTELDLTGPIGFEDLKRNILEPKQCLRCHSDYATESGLSAVVKAGAPEESLLFTSVQTGQMPKDAPPLNSNNLEYVRLYILQLAKTPVTPTLPVNDEPKGEISFEQLSQRIIRPYCIECHKRWTEYDKLKKHVKPGLSEESNFYNEIAAGTMPEDAPPLSLEDQEFVKRYIDTLKVTP